MFKLLYEKFKTADSYKKRGIIYLIFAVSFLFYEFVFHRPPDIKILLLWFGVIVIAVLVITTLKDPRQ